MTLFEYVAVAASLVCSFSAARVLGGVTATLRPERRYWIHTTWVFSVLFGISLAWWLFWSYREVDWNYLRFLIALSPLAIVYVLSSLLVPADAESVLSWRQHYFEIRVRFFALNLAYVAANALNAVVLLGQPVLDLQTLISGGIAAMFGAGMVSERPRLHAAIAVAQVLLMLLGASVLLRPGSYGATP